MNKREKMAKETENLAANETVKKIVEDASNLEDRISMLNDYQEKIGMYLLIKASEKVKKIGLRRNYGIIVLNEVYSHFNRAYDSLRDKLYEEISEKTEKIIPHLQRMLIASEQYLEEITAKREVIAMKTSEDIHPKVIEVISEKESDGFASPL
jgi:stalled ribosome rescue protein Dom34